MKITYCAALYKEEFGDWFCDVTIPPGTTVLAEEAFSSCNQLRNVVLPHGLQEIGNCAFLSCHNLLSITIPETLKVIGEDAFQDCTSLRQIILPEGLEEIRFRAFAGCGELKTLRLPASVQHLGGHILGPCGFGPGRANTEIETAPNSKRYCVKDGLLFDTHDRELIYCSKNKRGAVVIPPDTQKLALGAFYGCCMLTSLTIPKGITEISHLHLCEYPNLLLRVESGSEAEKYAKQTGMRFEVIQTNEQ